MPAPDLAVLAEGDLSTGEHWILRAGGTSTDFYTFLETVHPDGHRDEGGMGGPPLYPGSLLNTYTGGSERGLRRVVVRADPPHGFKGPVMSPAGLVSVTAIGAQGQKLEPQDLAGHEAGWQRFLRRHGRPQA